MKFEHIIFINACLNESNNIAVRCCCITVCLLQSICTLRYIVDKLAQFLFYLRRRRIIGDLLFNACVCVVYFTFLYLLRSVGCSSSYCDFIYVDLPAFIFASSFCFATDLIYRNRFSARTRCGVELAFNFPEFYFLVLCCS
jgi:hypothetical protein